MRKIFDELTIIQVETAAKYCRFDRTQYTQYTQYCRICPYANFGNKCAELLREDIVTLIGRVIPNMEVE